MLGTWYLVLYLVLGNAVFYDGCDRELHFCVFVPTFVLPFFQHINNYVLYNGFVIATWYLVLGNAVFYDGCEAVRGEVLQGFGLGFRRLQAFALSSY